MKADGVISAALNGAASCLPAPLPSTAGSQLNQCCRLQLSSARNDPHQMPERNALDENLRQRKVKSAVGYSREWQRNSQYGVQVAVGP